LTTVETSIRPNHKILIIPLERDDQPSMKLAWAMHWTVLILSDMPEYSEKLEIMKSIYFEGMLLLNSGACPARVEQLFSVRMDNEIYLT